MSPPIGIKSICVNCGQPVQYVLFKYQNAKSAWWVHQDPVMFRCQGIPAMAEGTRDPRGRW